MSLNSGEGRRNKQPDETRPAKSLEVLSLLVQRAARYGDSCKGFALVGPDYQAPINPGDCAAVFGPRPSGRFSVRTKPVGKSLFVFKNKASAYRTLGAA